MPRIDKLEVERINNNYEFEEGITYERQYN